MSIGKEIGIAIKKSIIEEKIEQSLHEKELLLKELSKLFTTLFISWYYEFA